MGIKLTKAFKIMRTKGLVARQNFTCCQSCGGAKISQMAEARGLDGFAFYHRQDADSLANGDGVYLAYGSRTGGDEEEIAVGRLVCEALTEAGLDYIWDGSNWTRIKVLEQEGL